MLQVRVAALSVPSKFAIVVPLSGLTSTAPKPSQKKASTVIMLTHHYDSTKIIIEIHTVAISAIILVIHSNLPSLTE